MEEVNKEEDNWLGQVLLQNHLSEIFELLD